MRGALVAFIVLVGGAPMAADWPQWRGPSGLGLSAESNLPTTWSRNENVAWSAALGGLGSSSPIVWRDQVFVTSQIGRLPLGDGAHPMLARDDATLVTRERPIGDRRAEPSDPSTPIVFVVESFDRSEGRRLWEHRLEARGPFPSLHEKHNLATPTPVTDGERVYAWFGTGQLVALDMRGGVVWSKHLGEEYSPFDINWGHGSSPVLYRDLLILLCDHESASYMVALDARTGKQRWKADRGKGRASHSTPLVVPAASGDEFLVNSSERIDGYDPATGVVLWFADAPRQTPIHGVFFASPVAADGKIYFASETGETIVVKAGRTPEILARNDLGVRLVASPAISNGRIFLRSDARLFAVGK